MQHSLYGRMFPQGTPVVLLITSNCKIISHFSIENRQISGAIPRYLCIFNRKCPKTPAVLLITGYVVGLSPPAIAADHVTPLTRAFADFWTSPVISSLFNGTIFISIEESLNNLHFLLKNLHLYIKSAPPK